LLQIEGYKKAHFSENPGRFELKLFMLHCGKLVKSHILSHGCIAAKPDLWFIAVNAGPIDRMRVYPALRYAASQNAVYGSLLREIL
jgi:hypothetical protein